uniref:Uncharacterized protein n=1 Tax=Cacopsylla melanoneura TaxID=428564 RepID=A0A8D8Z2W7_9HEMI
MKMLYVLSPPRTPPPSPWTSMRDTSPPLSCPSSNSNSSSSINSSCSYGSSPSERGRCEETGVFSTGREISANCCGRDDPRSFGSYKNKCGNGDGTSTRNCRHSTTSGIGKQDVNSSCTRKCRRLFERDGILFFENTSEKVANRNEGMICEQDVTASTNRNGPSGISTEGCRSVSKKAKMFSLNGRRDLNSVDSSTSGGHFPNRSQSEKSFSGGRHVIPAPAGSQSYAIRVSQSLGRCDQGQTDAVTSTNSHTFARDPLCGTYQHQNELSQNWSTKDVSNSLEHHHSEAPNGFKSVSHRRQGGNDAGEGVKLVTSKNKTSKATRIWLNAIEKANGGGTTFDGSHPTVKENFGGSSGGKENLVGVTTLKNGVALKSKVNNLQRDDGEFDVRGNEGGGKVTPTPRHYSKNVRCRLKRKVSDMFQYYIKR